MPDPLNVANAAGRSPRGRGSLHDHQHTAGSERSIPAWAGEPVAIARELPGARVDPRVGGGAHDGELECCGIKGRSPRGRGSRDGSARWRGRAGSIPAWAGEPPNPDAGTRSHRVDPRVGGGAAIMIGKVAGNNGRSPRGRGSHFFRPTTANWSGSIPAWAGEPEVSVMVLSPFWVDPRVGGGAAASAAGF